MASYKRLLTSGLVVFLMSCQTVTSSTHSTSAGNGASTDWRFYDGSLESTQYSALAQINKANVDQLVPRLEL